MVSGGYHLKLGGTGARRQLAFRGRRKYLTRGRHPIEFLLALQQGGDGLIEGGGQGRRKLPFQGTFVQQRLLLDRGGMFRATVSTSRGLGRCDLLKRAGEFHANLKHRLLRSTRIHPLNRCSRLSPSSTIGHTTGHVGLSGPLWSNGFTDRWKEIGVCPRAAAQGGRLRVCVGGVGGMGRDDEALVPLQEQSVHLLIAHGRVGQRAGQLGERGAGGRGYYGVVVPGGERSLRVGASVGVGIGGRGQRRPILGIAIAAASRSWLEEGGLLRRAAGAKPFTARRSLLVWRAKLLKQLVRH